MKMTIILQANGELAAAQIGSTEERGREGGLLAGPGQTLHEIEVPDEIVHVADAAQFAEHVRPHLPRR